MWAVIFAAEEWRGFRVGNSPGDPVAEDAEDAENGEESPTRRRPRRVRHRAFLSVFADGTNCRKESLLR